MTHQSGDDVEAMAQRVPGALSDSPLQMPRSAWFAILKRVYLMNGVHNLSLLAAGVAFFAFLAFVPLIAVVVLLYGLIADPSTVAASLDLLVDVVPPEVLVILREQLIQIVTTSATRQGLGLVLALPLLMADPGPVAAVLLPLASGGLAAVGLARGRWGERGQ